MRTPQEIAGRYAIEGRLGAGGMSTVFLAKDTVLERLVAVKLLAEHLADDEAFVARFRREALAAARLQHPNIVQVFDSGQDSESRRHFIVMEYVEGPSAADMLRDHDRLGLEETVRVVRDACHGLDYAHRAGVVHRDVKPGNLLVSDDTHATKLADFGIAKAAEQTRITQVGSVLGTAAYLSPEQARGDEAGPASDIYSLGVCAYQFLAGRLPHEYGSLTELALKQQQEDVEPITAHRSDVPPELDRAIRICLERDPDARFPSGLELARALDAGLQGEETEATRRLWSGGFDPDATHRMADDTGATQALRTQGIRPRPPVPPATPPRGVAVPPAPPAQAPPPQRKRGRRTGTFLVVLAVLLAIAAVALALLSTGGDGGAGIPPVEREDVQQQIDDLRQFLQDNTR